MERKTHARLRTGPADAVDLLRYKASRASAAAPRGSDVRPFSMSLTEDGESPTREPISAKVIPLARRSEMREAHVVMSQSLRDTVAGLQRQPVTGFRDNLSMPTKPAWLPPFSTIGERIVFWRERRGKSRPELAKLAKIPYSTLAEIENNRQKASTKITQIAAALRVNPHYLATDKGDPEDLTASPSLGEDESWPFPFPRSEIESLDPIELELVGLKIQRALDDIRAKRPRQKPRKVS